MNERRKKVPFDPYHMQKKVQDGVVYTSKEVFQQIYKTSHWKGTESASGEGSGFKETYRLRNELPGILKRFNIDKLIDAPCGDFSWMQHIDLPVTSYLGADIVPELISVNEKKFSDEQRNFIYLDLIQEPLPAADLLFCRDCLVHFSFTDIERFILNLKRSEISYLLTTTFTECTENEDITTGDWRVLNLEKEPFNLPSPLYILNEECNEGGGAFKDKSIGLWKIRDIPDPNPYV